MNELLKQIGLDQLTVAQRIELIEEIWDSIPESGQELPVPDWHREELNRRIAIADANPGTSVPWEEIRNRLNRRS